MSRKQSDEKSIVERAITEAQACEALQLAVLEAAVRSVGSIRDLRNALSDFTIIFRNAGTSPEAVLIRLKEVLDERTLPLPGFAPAYQMSPIIREQLVTWCIEEYFKPKRI